MRIIVFNVISDLKNKSGIIICFLFLVFWIVIVVIANSTKDFSFLRTLVHLYIQLIIGLFLYSYYLKNKCENKILNYILIAFAIQSIIIFLGIAFPSFRELIYATKTEKEIALQRHYQYRGLSLSGSGFFGLSLSYGIILILFPTEKNTLFRKSIFLRILLYFVLLFGAASAGRSGLFVGLLLSIISFIANKRYQKVKISRFFLAAFLSIIALYCIAKMVQSVLSANALSAFQYLIKYLDEFFAKGFSTTSTNRLWNMYFKIPYETFFFGDGRYMTDDGHYYMSTDAGYMRPILYAGIFCFIALFFLQKNIMDIGDTKKQNKKLYILIAIYILIEQIKGEVLGWAIMFNSVLLLFLLCNSRIGRLNDKCNNVYLQ